MKYRKKTIIIDAILFNGNNKKEIEKFVGSKLNKSSKTSNEIVIKTLEGNMFANKGDYIIKGIKGEFYPCKPDIFNLTYEKIKE